MRHEAVAYVTHQSAAEPQHPRMPEISRFYGIVIAMYWVDHPEPHFHAEYAGDVASIEIGSGELLAGKLPRRALRMVREWETLHRSELLANWRRAREREPLTRISPLP